MTEQHQSSGFVEVSPAAIATIASQAAMQCYGVVGMASKDVVRGITNMIAPDPRHGVDVIVHGQRLIIDLYVIVEYGTRIQTVADSLAHAVRFNVETTIGWPVEAVNIHVQGLRISSVDL